MLVGSFRLDRDCADRRDQQLRGSVWRAAYGRTRERHVLRKERRKEAVTAVSRGGEKQTGRVLRTCEAGDSGLFAAIDNGVEVRVIFGIATVEAQPRLLLARQGLRAVGRAPHNRRRGSESACGSRVAQLVVRSQNLKAREKERTLSASRQPERTSVLVI